MKKILVCEDEAAIREFVVLNLQKAGLRSVRPKPARTPLSFLKSRGTLTLLCSTLCFPE